MAVDMGSEQGVTYVYNQLANVAFQRVRSNTRMVVNISFFCFPWGSPEPQSLDPNFVFFREALAIL